MSYNNTVIETQPTVDHKSYQINQMLSILKCYIWRNVS